MLNFHIFSARSEYGWAFRVPLSHGPVLILGIVAALGVHVASMQVPLMQRILQTNRSRRAAQ